MRANRFTISCRSDWRRETPAEIGQKFLRILDTLSAISPHFSSWGLVDLNGEPKETGFVLDDARAGFTQIVERGVMTDEDGHPDPGGGYAVSAFNHVDDPTTNPFSVNLNVRGGGDAGRTWRSAQFRTGCDVTPDASIVTYPVFKSVLTTLIPIWDITSGQAFSSELTRNWDYPPFDFDLNWMTWLSPPLAAQITPPEGAAVERTEGGGLLLIAAEETFDAENPKHMEAARRIRDALAPINNLPQHELDKRKREEADRRSKAMGFQGRRDI